MPAAIVAWLIAHQAIAGTLAVWFGCTAAGIDVVDKAVQLERELVGPPAIVAPQKPEAERSRE
jgi:hypothetical protein